MAIDLGSFVNVGGKTVGSGIVSGLDVDGIVTALTDAKKIPVTRLEDSIKVNNSKATAYGGLKSALETLKTASNFLRSVPGFAQDENNIFQYRNVGLTSSNSSVLVDNILAATASAGADLSNFQLQVKQLAAAKQTRSDPFTSRTTSVTEATGGTTAGKFSAGTFQFVTSQQLQSSTSSITSTTFGAGDGVLVAANAISGAFVGTNSQALMGGIASIASTVNGTDVDVSVTLDNGQVFTATIPANAGAGTDSIVAGTYTFNNAVDGSAFDLDVIADTVIAGSQVNADAFSASLETALSAVSFAQSRTLSNLNTTSLSGTALSGLTASSVRVISDDIATDGSFGLITDFNVTAVSAPGAADATITVTIDGETYQAVGLGDEPSDTETGTLVLQSTTSDKRLEIDLSDASLVASFSTSGAAALESALNKLSPAKVADITIDEGDALNDIVTKINNATASSGVRATIIQVSSTDFRLSLESDTTGLENAFTIQDPDGVMSQVVFSNTRLPLDAIFSIDGVELTRSTNTVTDAVDGMTMNLKGITANYGLINADYIQVGVTEDTATVESAIINFINAYNEVRVFVAKQTQRDDTGALLEDAVLGRDSSLRTIEQQLASEVNRIVDTNDPLFARLSDIGITLTNFPGDDENPATNNILTYDPTKLTNAIANNFDKIREIFEFTFTSSDENLAISSRTNEITLSDFTLDIDMSRAVGDQVRVLDSNGLLLYNADITGSGGVYTITGQDGTSIDGLKMLYTGATLNSVSVSLSAGIADRMYNVSDGAVKAGGTIESLLTGLDDEETRYQTEIDRINEQIETYRQRLLTQYQALETAITRINSILDYLDANNKALYANNS